MTPTWIVTRWTARVIGKRLGLHLLLLDEVLANLDSSVVERVVGLLTTRTVIVTSHQPLPIPADVVVILG